MLINLYLPALFVESIITDFSLIRSIKYLTLIVTSKAVFYILDSFIDSTLEVEKYFVNDMTVITLNSVGVFESDFTTCTPVDAYGTYETKVWNVTNSSSSLGSPQFNAYARNSFSGELNIGIDAVNMTVQAFGYTSTLHCDALGHYSADWN